MTTMGGSGRDLNPFLFIVGRGRSGTTLVRSMLTSHSHLAIPRETHFVVPLSRDPRLQSNSGELRAGPFLERLKRQPGFQQMELNEDEVNRAFSESHPSDYSDAIRLVFSLYARSKGKERYGDKTPIHVLHVDYLSKLFPEARFLHVIRDGRDVTLSYLDVDFGVDTLWDGAVYWKRFVEAGRRAGAALGSERYREIRYEDLIDAPERNISNLCEFVGIEYERAMLRYFENDGDIGRAVRHHRNLRLPPTSGLRDWRKEMSRPDLAVFDVLAGDLLEDLGYEPGVTHPGLRDRARARTHWIGIQARRSMRSMRKRSQRARKHLQEI